VYPLSKTVQVTVLDPPRTRNGTHQAPLEELLENVFPGNNNIGTLISRIQAYALVRVRERFRTSSEIWSMITPENWAKWESQFTGKYHCESMMSCLRGVNYEEIEDMVEPKERKGFKDIVSTLKVRSFRLH